MLFFTGWTLVAQMGYVAWAQGAQFLRLKDVVMAPGVADALRVLCRLPCQGTHRGILALCLKGRDGVLLGLRNLLFCLCGLKTPAILPATEYARD